MNRYHRTLRGIWITCAVIAIGSGIVSLILMAAARGALTGESLMGGVGLLTISSIFLSAVGLFGGLWLLAFLAYLITASVAEGHAEIVAALRQASPNGTRSVPARGSEPHRIDHPTPAAAPDQTRPPQPTNADLPVPATPDNTGLSATLAGLVGQKVLVRGYTTTQPSQFRRVEGILSQDSAGQYWIGNTRIDNLKDTKLEIVKG